VSGAVRKEYGDEQEKRERERERVAAKQEEVGVDLEVVHGPGGFPTEKGPIKITEEAERNWCWRFSSWVGR
jgi:hypothetical protein